MPCATQDILERKVAGRVIWGNPTASLPCSHQAVELPGPLVSHNVAIIARLCPLFKKTPIGSQFSPRNTKLHRVL